MNIKTYNARDMRGALRRVREEHGPDAVILSTRHLPDGVEVTVAMDIEAMADAPATSPAPPVTIARFFVIRFSSPQGQ